MEHISDLEEYISIDTYFDDVIQYIISNCPNIKYLNLQKQELKNETLKLIADRNLKIVVMLNGTDFSYFENHISELEKQGILRNNIIVDPGIGFGKTKQENINIIKNDLHKLKEFGCEVMLAHSRKSFISNFSNTTAENRDIETIAISAYSFDSTEVDYLRIHDVKSHMRFFVTKKYMEN